MLGLQLWLYVGIDTLCLNIVYECRYDAWVGYTHTYEFLIF